MDLCQVPDGSRPFTDLYAVEIWGVATLYTGLVNAFDFGKFHTVAQLCQFHVEFSFCFFDPQRLR